MCTNSCRQEQNRSFSSHLFVVPAPAPDFSAPLRSPVRWVLRFPGIVAFEDIAQLRVYGHNWGGRGVVGTCRCGLVGRLRARGVAKEEPIIAYVGGVGDLWWRSSGVQGAKC